MTIGMSFHVHALAVLGIMTINIASYHTDGTQIKIKFISQEQKYKNKNIILSKCQSLTERIEITGKNPLFSTI